MALVCIKCGWPILPRAKTCPQCGSAFTKPNQERTINDADATSLLKGYKLVRMAGASVACAGIIAAIAGSQAAATVFIAIGITAYITGLLGAWWNTGD